MYEKLIEDLKQYNEEGKIVRLTKTSDSFGGMVWFRSQGRNDLWLEPCEMTPHDCRVAINKLAAYEDAEEQGRLVMLPVKPGDYLYRKYNSGMQVYTVYNVQVRTDHFWINVIQKEPPTLYPFRDYVDGRDIGKTVFLTREEAEAAMKGE